MSDLKNSIKKSIEESIDLIASTYPEDNFYAVAVSTDTDLESLIISANSYQNYSKELSELSFFDRLISKNYFKWGREEWGVFDGFSKLSKIREVWEAPYKIKNELITDAHNSRHVGSDFPTLPILAAEKDRNAAIYHNAEFLLTTICMALKEVGNSTWEKLNKRSEMLIFATFEPDNEEAVRWNSAQLLNAGIVNPTLLKEFRKVCKS